MKICVLDVPVLFFAGMLIGWLHAKVWHRERKELFIVLLAVVVGVFWLNGFLSALGAVEPWLLGLFCRPASRWIALFYFLSYGMWFYYGANTSWRLFGRAPDQGGFLGLLSSRDSTEPFAAPWKTE